MTEENSKLIISSVFVIRILIFRVILRPWEIVSDIKPKKDISDLMLFLGSLLYYISIDIMKDENSIISNQSHQLRKTRTNIEPLWARGIRKSL